MAAYYDALFFTPATNASSMLELAGANAALNLSRGYTRYYFGYTADATSAVGNETVKFTLPAAGWTTAPLRVAGKDSKFYIGHNMQFAVDATALGTPAAGAPVTVPLISTTDGIRACNSDPAGYAAPAALELVAPANGAADIPVVRPGHTAFFALDRDARWAAVDNAAYRDAMVETSSFPQEVAFAWQGGTAPYGFTLRRARDNQVVKTAAGLADAAFSVGNLETGRAYVWQVTDTADAAVTGAFTTAYADQRFLKVGATNAAAVVRQYSSAKSAAIHTNTIPNFRDLGGMFTADGTRRVRQNLVFRSFCFDRPGSYVVTLSLVDPAIYHWSDGSTQDKTVEFAITGELPSIVPPVIGAGEGSAAAIEISGGNFNVRVINAVRGYSYGYRKAASPAGPWSDVIPLGGAHDSDATEKVLPIPMETTEPRCFYRIVVW